MRLRVYITWHYSFLLAHTSIVWFLIKKRELHYIVYNELVIKSYLTLWSYYMRILLMFDWQMNWWHSGTSACQVHHSYWRKLNSFFSLQPPSISPQCQDSHQQPSWFVLRWDRNHLQLMIAKKKSKLIFPQIPIKVFLKLLEWPLSARRVSWLKDCKFNLRRT